MIHKKKRQRDIVRYERWLRTRDIYPDLTFGEFLRNGPGGRKQKGITCTYCKDGINHIRDRHCAEVKS